jgi:hypothetical protein
MPNAPATTARFGGSFAPPIDTPTLDRYEELATSSSAPEVQDGMLALIRMMREFWKTPVSKMAGTPHPSGRGVKIPLEGDVVKTLDPHVPFRHELDALSGVFDQMIGDPERRKAAFHLLWFGYELTNDREPCTTDKL